MKLYELFEKFPRKSSDDFFDEQDHAERLYNKEAWDARKEQEEFYKNRRMGIEGFVPVFEKPPVEDKQDIWSTKPNKEEHPPSAGFSGRENVKRRAGHQNYDRSADLSSPHDEPAIPPDQKSLIDKALRRLGLD